MDIRFPIRWSQAWRSLTVYMSLAILVPLLIFVGIDVIRTKTFGHLTPIEIGIGILAIIAFSCVFSLGMTLLMRLMAVRLTDDFIEGRNYWGLTRLPLFAGFRGEPVFIFNGLGEKVGHTSRLWAVRSYWLSG